MGKKMNLSSAAMLLLHEHEEVRLADSEDWVFGATLNICGSVFINLGTNLMKLGILRFQKRRRRVALQDALLPHAVPRQSVEEITQPRRHHQPSSSSKRLVFRCCQDAWTWTPSSRHPCRCRRALLSKTWFFGFIAFILGNVLNFLSFGYAAQSLLASLGSVQFVTNVIFARVVLKEAITARTLLGTMVLIAGMCLVVGFSCHGNPAVQYSLNKLISLFYDVPYLIYLACLAALLCASLFILHREREREDVAKPAGGDKLEAFAYAAVSAIVGAQAVTFFKILSELMGIAASVTPTDHVTKSAILRSPFTYFVLLAAILTSAFWMHRLNEALRLYNVILIIPLFQVMWVSLSVVGGGIFFHEFGAHCFRGETAFMFILGLLVIFFGVYLLSQQAEEGVVGAGLQEEARQEQQLRAEEEAAASLEQRLAVLEDVEHGRYDEYEEEEEEEEAPSTLSLQRRASSYNFGFNVVPVFGVVERRNYNPVHLSPIVHTAPAATFGPAAATSSPSASSSPSVIEPPL